MLAFATAESDTISDTSAVRLVAEQIGYGAFAGALAGGRGGGVLVAGRASNRRERGCRSSH